MPMLWNAEADAKLLAAIIQVYDVKVSGVKLNEVAEIMGPDCTAKALTHRIAKIRTIANDNPTSATAQKDEKKTPAKATKSAATPKKSAKVGKKAAAERAAPSSADGGDEYLTPPESVRPKRVGTKRDYAAMNGEGSGTDPEDEEIGEDGLSKKVKIEVGEDIGEGLRSAINEDEYGDGK